ncbi:MAG: hypothetical protein AAGF30_08740 [Pseudomonadota bacterium]
MPDTLRETLEETDQDDLPLELFNVVVGLIFDSLVREFPMWRRLTPGYLGKSFETLVDFAEAEEVLPTGRIRQAKDNYMLRSNVPPDMYIKESVDWLVAEGFLLGRNTPIGRDGIQSLTEHTLSARTLEILNRPMPGLGQSYANRLSDAARAGGGEAGKAAIGEIVGQIIGAATKSMAGLG